MKQVVSKSAKNDKNEASKNDCRFRPVFNTFLVLPENRHFFHFSKKLFSPVFHFWKNLCHRFVTGFFTAPKCFFTKVFTRVSTRTPGLRLQLGAHSSMAHRPGNHGRTHLPEVRPGAQEPQGLRAPGLQGPRAPGPKGPKGPRTQGPQVLKSLRAQKRQWRASQILSPHIWAMSSS